MAVSIHRASADGLPSPLQCSLRRQSGAVATVCSIRHLHRIQAHSSNDRLLGFSRFSSFSSFCSGCELIDPAEGDSGLQRMVYICTQNLAAHRRKRLIRQSCSDIDSYMEPFHFGGDPAILALSMVMSAFSLLSLSLCLSLSPSPSLSVSLSLSNLWCGRGANGITDEFHGRVTNDGRMRGLQMMNGIWRAVHG